jgi:hypothetical protein
MTDDELADLRSKMAGCTFEVENDPNYPGFYSVFAYRGGSGAEVAGKIGVRAAAVLLASSLRMVC